MPISEHKRAQSGHPAAGCTFRMNRKCRISLILVFHRGNFSRNVRLCGALASRIFWVEKKKAPSLRIYATRSFDCAYFQPDQTTPSGRKSAPNILNFRNFRNPQCVRPYITITHATIDAGDSEEHLLWNQSLDLDVLTKKTTVEYSAFCEGHIPGTRDVPAVIQLRKDQCVVNRATWASWIGSGTIPTLGMSP